MEFAAFLKTYQLETLDPQQRKAVEKTAGPILLLAVPGSGKTTTLVARLGYLIYGLGVDPRRILTMTYTVAATKEMRLRFSKRFGPEYAEDFECRTINGLCCKIIEAYARLGHTPPKLAEERQQSVILRDVWAELDAGFPTEQDIRTAKIFIANVKNRMLKDDKEMRKFADTLKSDSDVDFIRVYKRYQEILRRNQMMDYDDQMVFALAILKREPGVLEKFQNQYQYIFVDEAQDTSKIQHEIISLLAQAHQNLFLVGDEDQSIYGFRAANPQELLEFEKRWPGGTVLFIETNYRSTPEIIGAAVRVIRKNQERRDKKMRAAQPSNGVNVAEMRCDNRMQQYEKLVELARHAAAPGSEELAILYRNNDTSLPIIDRLEKAGIPYRSKAVDTMFFICREFTDIKAFFQLAQNPADGDAFLRIYSKIKGLYMNKQTAIGIAESGGSVLDQLGQSSARWSRVAAIVSAFRLIRCMDAVHAIREIRYSLGYNEWLTRQGGDMFRLSILEMLAQGHKTPQAFVEHMEGPGGLKEIIARGGKGDTGCILSTIHSSKGLEYDNVILADVFDKILPSPDAIQEEKDGGPAPTMEEERRIFYVGATRAKKTLRIVTCDGLPSRFADDLLGKESPAEKDKHKAPEQLSPWLRDAGLKTSISLNPQGAAGTAVVFKRGDRVRHRQFGTATVQKADDMQVTLLFDKPQMVKSFLTSYAVNAGLLEKI